MTTDGASRGMRIATSRPVVVVLYLLVLFLWAAVFFYLVPTATGGWFGPTISVIFGIVSVAPMAYVGVVSAWRVVTGKPLVDEEPAVCANCGQVINGANPPAP
ncbi:MAG: hypothetical protein ACTHM6_01820 [Tepidisphaeraceae bacterium]